MVWVMKMDKEKELPKRKSTRLKNFDYSTKGAYFITICTHNRKCVLSRIVGAIHESPEIQLTEYGKIVDKVINNFSNGSNVMIDRYVIMPNHIHMIVIIESDEELRAIRGLGEANVTSPLQVRSAVSKVIGYIKMNSSKEIHNIYGNTTVWQRGFYDHIIRNREDYNEINKYIHENPARWFYDELYSEE